MKLHRSGDTKDEKLTNAPPAGGGGTHPVALGSDVSGTLPVANGGTGQTAEQAAIDALTAVSGATDEHVLTKDTASGNATFKAAAGGSHPVIADNTIPMGDGTTVEDSGIVLDAPGTSIVSGLVDVALSGTADGRDIATDGTKLDTVETNADVTDATNVAAAGATMSVFGRTGTVVATEGDYDIDEIGDVDTTTSAPSLNEVLKWDGSNWVPGIAGDTAEFTFSIASFSDGIGSGNILMGATGDYAAIGAITFTATYNNEPGGMLAFVAVGGDHAAWSVQPMPLTPTSGQTNDEAVTWPTGSYPWSITFTLSQDADGSTSVQTLTFTNAIYWGDSLVASGYVSGDVTGLTGSITNNDHTRSGMSVTGVGASDYVLFACPARLSNLSSVNFTYNGLVIAMQTAETISVTNASGYVENFEVYRSTLQNLGDHTLVSNQSTAQNLMYWGHVASSSGITEAQVESLSGGSSTISNSMSSRAMTITGAGASDHTVIAYPSRLGALTSIIIGGFESIGDFNVDSTSLSITNVNGYVETYRVYVSVNPEFADPTTMTVTI